MSVYVPAFLCLYVAVHASVIECVCVCVCLWHRLSDFALPCWPHSRAQQHVNGGRKRQSCHRGAGGAPSLWRDHSRTSRTHTESEPHPVSTSDTHHPVAGSSLSRSHEESQSHSLQHSLAHTVAEVRLSPHTQPLSHDQGREGSTGLCREAHQAHRTALPQNSGAGKVIFFFLFVCVCVVLQVVIRCDGIISRWCDPCFDPLLCCQALNLSETLNLIWWLSLASEWLHKIGQREGMCDLFSRLSFRD